MLYCIGVAAVETTRLEVGVTNSDDSKIESSTATESERWNLNQTEWDRYHSLLKGVRGHLSVATISPIEVLGIHARNDAERVKYARMWAQVLIADAARVLAFQRAYDEEVARLVAEQPLIDDSLIEDREARRFQLQSTDRILFFTALDCPICDVLFARVLKRKDQLAAVNVYFIGLGASDRLKALAWLQNFKAAQQMYRDSRLAIHFDAPDDLNVSFTPDEAPMLLVLRDGKTHRVPGYVFP